MTKPKMSKGVAALGACLAACVNQGVYSEAPPAGAGSNEVRPIDISDAPQRGGPNSATADDGREPTIDDSPPISRVLAVTDPASVPDGVARTNRFRRLSLDEYDRSVRQLLGLDVGSVSSDFPEELPTLQGYFAIGDLRATDRLIVELQHAAERLAAQTLTDAGAYAKVVGCGSGDVGCRESFVRSFGLRAYRRPLSDAEGRALLRAIRLGGGAPPKWGCLS